MRRLHCRVEDNIRAAGEALIMLPGPSVGAGGEVLHRSVPVIAVGDAYRIAWRCDAVYHADGQWWDLHVQDVKRWASVENLPGRFVGVDLWTVDEKAARDYGINYMEGAKKSGLSDAPFLIHCGEGAGANSGLQAMALAYQWGARVIYLDGMDLSRINGRLHFFGEHPAAIDRANRDIAAWQAEIEKTITALVAEGVRVINLSPHSQIAGAENVGYQPERARA